MKHLTDGVTVRIYSPAKTLADCSKCRNKIGMDVVLEAMKLFKFLGLAQVESVAEEKYNNQYRVKKLPLLAESVKFNITR